MDELAIISTCAVRGSERDVREAFIDAQGGPYTIHLSVSEGRRAWLSVKIVGPRSVVAASVPPDEQRGEALRRRLSALQCQN